MKLSEYAKKQGVCYQTALNWFNKGIIPNAKQLPTGTILVSENAFEIPKDSKIVIYHFTARKPLLS